VSLAELVGGSPREPGSTQVFRQHAGGAVGRRCAGHHAVAPKRLLVVVVGGSVVVVVDVVVVDEVVVVDGGALVAARFFNATGNTTSAPTSRQRASRRCGRGDDGARHGGEFKGTGKSGLTAPIRWWAGRPRRGRRWCG
jgi:hypothetical protein